MSGDNSTILSESSKVMDFFYYEIKEDLLKFKSDNKHEKISSLKLFKKKVTQKLEEFSNDEYEILVNYTHKPILHLLSDNSETCRELALSIIIFYTNHIKNIENIVTYSFPLLIQRLGGKEVVESSEEIRLLEIQLVTLVIEKYDNKILAYLDGIIQILQNTIIDPFPEIKKESSHCAGILASTLKKHFYLKSDNLVKPLIQNLSHQHAKVRVIAIKALGIVILNGDNKCVGEIAGHFAQRLFDQSPMVRKEIVVVIGRWLCELPDRYSFFSKLIPLMLTCIMDEIPEISLLAQDLWIQAGELYLKENENDHKDVIDFDTIAVLPEIHFKRSLGCKILAQRYAYYIIPGLINDLNDWLDETRLKSSQLLYMLTIFIEEKIAAYLDKLFPALCKSITAKSKESEMLEKACKYISLFSDADIWMNILFKYFSTSTPNVRVLASLLQGTKNISENGINQMNQQMMELTENRTEFLPLKECVEALLQIPSFPAYTLFYITILLQSQQVEGADKIMEKVSKYSNMNSIEDLYELYGKVLFEQLGKDYQLWTANSIGFEMYATLLIKLKKYIAVFSDTIFPVIELTFKCSADSKLKVQLFMLLTELLPDLKIGWINAGKLTESSISLLKLIVLPNLEWRAGRSASAIRSACIVFLYKMVTENLLFEETLAEAGVLLSHLLSLLEDGSNITKKTAILILTQLFPSFVRLLEYKDLNKVYPEVLSRLDDSQNEIRILSAQFFVVFFNTRAESKDINFAAFFPDIFKGILIHMDDSDGKFQESMLSILIQVSNFDSETALTIIEQEKHKHRTTLYCKLLEDHVKAINTETKASNA